MNIRHYTMLVPIVLSACRVEQGSKNGNVLEDSGSAYEDTGVLDSGLLDTALSAAEQWCASSSVPETVPYVQLLPNHYALTDSDEFFETNNGSSSAPVITDSGYILSDTYGCSCKQILACKASGTGAEYEYGCTKGTLEDWINQRGWASDCLD